MKCIKINFVDFWRGFDPNDNLIMNTLRKKCSYIELSNAPDYLFCSCFGSKHWNYKECVKIYYSAENDIPDFNIYDYAIGLRDLSFRGGGENRYFYFPSFLGANWEKWNEWEKEWNLYMKSDLVHRKFCNFIYSNNKWAIPFRNEFFIELSKYKKIDSGGLVFNNIGGKIVDKLSFIRDYKFTIAIENSSAEGYITEKITDPFFVHSMPIYYGDPLVHKYFDVNSFVNLHNFKSVKDAIDYIIYLDENDEKYLDKMRNYPFLTKGIVPLYEKKLFDYLFSILNRPLEEAHRITYYGFSSVYRNKRRKIDSLSALSFKIKKYINLIK